MWKKRSIAPRRKSRPARRQHRSPKLVCPARISRIKEAWKVVALYSVVGSDGLVRLTSLLVRHRIAVNCYQIQSPSIRSSIRSASFLPDSASDTVRLHFQLFLIHPDAILVSSTKVWLMSSNWLVKMATAIRSTSRTFGSLGPVQSTERYIILNVCVPHLSITFYRVVVNMYTHCQWRSNWKKRPDGRLVWQAQSTVMVWRDSLLHRCLFFHSSFPLSFDAKFFHHILVYFLLISVDCWILLLFLELYMLRGGYGRQTNWKGERTTFVRRPFFFDLRICSVWLCYPLSETVVGFCSCRIEFVFFPFFFSWSFATISFLLSSLTVSVVRQLEPKRDAMLSRTRPRRLPYRAPFFFTIAPTKLHGTSFTKGNLSRRLGPLFLCPEEVNFCFLSREVFSLSFTWEFFRIPKSQ